MMSVLVVMAANLAALLAGGLGGMAVAFAILGPQRMRERLRELRP